MHPNPTTDDLAAGAAAVTGAAAPRITLAAVGGGSPIDAIVAVPTTAGTGAETNAFGVVTDPAARRKFYAGHASSMPAAAILDPALTVGLPPAVTAATGMDALTHALESYLSLRPNPWSDGIALQVIRIAASLPRADADGADLRARSQMLLAAHMADAAMASTGLGLCHAIGLTAMIADFGVTEADFAQVAADALDDEVLVSTPGVPSSADIGAILLAS